MVLGVKAIIVLGKGELFVGSGDGMVEHVKERDESHLNDPTSSKMKDPTLPMLLSVSKLIKIFLNLIFGEYFGNKLIEVK